MEVEQESLDLIEPTQDHVETENIEMSEEIQFDSEKTDTEPQNDEGNFLIDRWNSSREGFHMNIWPFRVNLETKPVVLDF